MSKKIRSAIVGCGVIGPTHAKSLADIPNAELVAVCDIMPERAEKLAAAYPGVTAYTDYKTMLDKADFDLIHVCLPSGMHADFGVMAAQSGRNVLTEKPIDVTLQAADRLIEACDKQGVTLSVISQRRWDDGIVQAKKWIDAGRLGKLTTGISRTTWFRAQSYYDSGEWRGTWALDGGGALTNQSVHYVDLLQYLMGEVEEVTAYCATLSHQRIEVEDLAVAALKFKSGALGLLEGNTTAFPGFDTSLEVFGTEGGVLTRDGHIEQYKFADAQWKIGEALPGEAASDPTAIRLDLHATQISDVVNAILEKRAPAITGRDGRVPMAVILAVYESARKGAPVKVSY